MQLPSSNPSYADRVSFGHYVIARLRAEGHDEQALDVERLTTEVKVKARSWEDAHQALTTHCARRDALYNELDQAVQQFRIALAAQQAGSAENGAYASLFAQGIAYYTGVALLRTAARMKELVSRAEKHLPEASPELARLKAAVLPALEAFESTRSALEEAHSRARVTRTALEMHADEWELQLKRIHRALCLDLGQAAADAVFRR